ncbi:MAG: hypothetical protein PHE89_05015 [Alphaproteobacteria bacterium]|nr:hypothetical protein [Alphaproteobacteria bacterium]
MPTNMIVLNDADKRTYLRCLTYVLHLGDGEAHKTSRKEIFIENQLREVGLPIEELQSIRVPKKSNALVVELKEVHDVKVKRYIVREMILLAIADHELNDEEISIIYQIGVKAGIKEEKISDFFMWAAKGVEWQIEGIKLIEEDL